ncbi:hypothetical protein PC39_08369 [Salinisphaera sp. PC39]|uniref:Tll0287-like domain-containing protein n=1 Tax=Salinisphaera sp. PC39 TaxID=1304156 RepID=UPI00333EA1B2
MRFPFRAAGLLGVLLVVGLGCSERSAVPEVDEAALTQEADHMIGRFSTDLKARLQAGMREGGPVAAIEVCHVDAPRIASSVSATGDWQVARTSLKVRNPDNEPDAWEREVLADFEARRAAGVPASELTRFEVLENAAGKPVARYMRAIPTQPLCVSCHGAELAPAVADKLDELYPEDKARGFSVGDIRGAFTLRKPL